MPSSLLNLNPPGPIVPGISGAPPVDVAVGGGAFAGSNLLTSSIAGQEVAMLAGGLTLAFNSFKHLAWFDQQRFGQITLLCFGLAIGVLAFHLFGGVDLVTSIAKGCGIATQSWADYVSVRATGLGGLPPAQAVGG